MWHTQFELHISTDRFVIIFFFVTRFLSEQNHMTLTYSSSPSHLIKLYSRATQKLERSTLIYSLYYIKWLHGYLNYLPQTITGEQKWLSIPLSDRHVVSIILWALPVYPPIQCSVTRLLSTKIILPIPSKQIHTHHITEIIYNCCNPLSLRKSIVHRNTNQYIRTFKNRIPFRHVMQHIDT